ncbi:MAG: TIGR00300 family protein [Tissierellia bacterium]|nr:TIGR00300 family protein [Tissierellia bacterium]
MYYYSNRQGRATLAPAPKDGCVPEGFYSTTNYPTFVREKDQWEQVQLQRMDAVIVKKEEGYIATKLRDVREGDLIVLGDEGVYIDAKLKDPGDPARFQFMDSEVSSEKRNELIIEDLAKSLVFEGKQMTIVCGPAVVHTGANKYMAQLIAMGYVKALLAGNAVAVHDMEQNFFGTSLGVDKDTGRQVFNGYRNHMRAINRIKLAGSIKNAVEEGTLTGGIMYELTTHNVPYVLAGSLRDDGPLPETEMNMIEAQTQYNLHLRAADMVLVMATMLHGIASGNMLPNYIPMYCIDIAPNVVTKLSDRGSDQNIGIVTDIGLFLKLLISEIKLLELERDGK